LRSTYLSSDSLWGAHLLEPDEDRFTVDERGLADSFGGDKIEYAEAVASLRSDATEVNPLVHRIPGDPHYMIIWRQTMIVYDLEYEPRRVTFVAVGTFST